MAFRLPTSSTASVGRSRYRGEQQRSRPAATKMQPHALELLSFLFRLPTTLPTPIYRARLRIQRRDYPTFSPIQLLGEAILQERRARYREALMLLRKPFQALWSCWRVSPVLSALNVNHGKCQGSCRTNHVAFAKVSSCSRGGFPGLSKTEVVGVQLRVDPDQRVGLASLAAS